MKLNLKINYLFNLFYVTFIFLLSIDSFRNPLKSQEIIGLSIYKLIIPFLILQLILNWKYKIKLAPKINRILFYLSIPIALMTILMSVVSVITPPNYIFTITNLNQQQLGFLSFFIIMSLLFNKSKIWWRKNINKIIFFTPFILVSVLIIVSLWPNDIFKKMVLEDHLIENSQFVILFIGGIVSLFFSFKLRVKNKYLYYLFVTISICFFLVSGDEISWGQRIFNLKTIDVIAPYNLQNENTIHNLDFFDQYIRVGYILFSLLGIFAKPIAKVLNKKNLVNWLPDYIFLGYFLFSAIYNILEYFSLNKSIKDWAEPMELFLYCGLVFFFIHQGYHKIKKSNISTL